MDKNEMIISAATEMMLQLIDKDMLTAGDSQAGVEKYGEYFKTLSQKVNEAFDAIT